MGIENMGVNNICCCSSSSLIYFVFSFLIRGRILIMNFGPQVNIGVPPGIMNESSSNPANQSWQGLTIKEILEKVDLSNIIMDEDKKKVQDKFSNQSMMTNGVINPESAFLGPKLWSKPVPMPVTGENDDFSVMNIDDFLSENGFDLEEQQPSSPGSIGVSSPRSGISEMETDFEPMPARKATKRAAPALDSGSDGNSKKTMDTTFLYAESKKARLEREKEEKKNRSINDIEFSPQELALATVPGMKFDPRQRSFAPDELRPQPIIRKRKKSYVPSEAKDGKYWEKREKNNVAARRSREARRLKENQIALRTAFLEKENGQLKAALDEAKAENMELVAEKEILLVKLKQYE